jgi:uncharacterized RDD family membrane protein YckC
MNYPKTKKRFIAGCIDYFVIYLLCWAYIFYVGEPDGEGGYHVSGLPALIPIIIWMVFTVGIEQLSGATMGNTMMDIKAISLKHNQILSFSQSLKRHLLDPIDMFFFGLVAIIVIRKTEHRQRLGDLWADTTVVSSK